MGESKVDKAVACFDEGFNCSSSVFSTYCEDFGLDKETGLKLSCPLGGGMGRLQGTCGAVSGAYLLIGLKHGMYLKEDPDARIKTYDMVREFARLFAERNESTNCRDIIGVDLLKDDPQITSARIKEVCPKMVKDAAEIVEQLLYAD